MKYCGTCGKELMDETVRCPDCKTHQGGKKSNGVSRGLALNTVALVINLGIAAFFYYPIPDSYDREATTSTSGLTISPTIQSNSADALNTHLLPIWLSTVILIFALGILAAHFCKSYDNKLLAYVYLIASLLLCALLLLLVPNILALLFCVIGIIFFVPTILQVKAGISFISS